MLVPVIRKELISLNFITGDTHREFTRVRCLCAQMLTTKGDDTLIILGDAGINYYGKDRDERLKKTLAALPITLFCIHGNHEKNPEFLGYDTIRWNDGDAYIEPEFPNIIYAKDGEIYNISGKRCLVIGGAYSVDKYYRLECDAPWFPDEQPSQEVKDRVEWRLDKADWTVDVVLSHTCPIKYEPTEVFLRGIDQSMVDKSTEEWLGSIEKELRYKRWYCGHYHTEKTVDSVEFLFTSVKEFCTETRRSS